MIKFAVLGTSKITGEFLKTAQRFENFSLEAIYSRDYTKGLTFGKNFSCSKVYTDLDKLGQDPAIDAVYIASPNYLHCQQAIKLMEYKKNVLCEKPFASNSLEVDAMITAARENKVLLMEAMKTPFMPIIQIIKRQLHRVGLIRRVYFNYSQYSSRYDAFREGIIENAFKPELSNGALVDIGIYPLFAMLYLFGKSADITARAKFLDTGVDGVGTISKSYANFLGDIHYSKISNSLIPSEIQGEDGNILINMIAIGTSAKLYLRTGEIIDLGTETRDSFYYEIQEFLELAESGHLESQIMTHNLSRELMLELDEIRRQIGLIYPADNKL